jgi:3-oxoacyl-[acyl-carrier-protein] synthase II
MEPTIPKRPVSICGVGAVTGYGWGEKLLREGLYTSESAVRCRSGFSPAFDDDWGWVATVEDAGDPDDGPSRFMRAVRHSGREAVHNAFDRGWRPGGVVGLVHGIVLGDVDHLRTYYRRHEGASRRNWLELMPSTVLMEFMREFNFHGPTMAVTAMCASGVAGLLTARLWINAGLATDVVVIASDLSFSPENARSFSNLGVLHVDAPSWDVCRPFQEGSRGFNGGEASVAMVVSGRPQASYATVLGGAMTSDAYHPVSIAPDYAQVRRAFTGALEDAGVLGSDIAYLNAHGTGTAQCDGVEATLLDELLPAAEGIFSLKPLVGHTQGASAALEILATLYGFQTGVIPAPRRISKGHPKLLDGLTAGAEGPVMKSSLGMGGHNAAVVLEAPVG